MSPKSGVCLGASEGVLQGSFEPRPKMSPKSDLKVSKKTLFGHFYVTFRRAPRALLQTLSGTPRFLETLSWTLPGALRARRALRWAKSRDSNRESLAI